jgi:hypothetical protein
MSVCPETWNAERTALAVESLHRVGCLRLQLRGVSMLPSLWPGDEVEIVRCLHSDLKCGDVVLGIRSGHFILHRLLGFSENGDVITRGDAMPRPDLGVPADSILGTVVTVRRGWRSVPLLRRRVRFQRALGVLLCYSGLARGIALRFHNLRNHQKRKWLQIDKLTFDREPLQIAETRQAVSLQPELVSTR